MARRIAVCLLLLACASALWAQTQRWEIEPKVDPDLAFGKISVIGGMTNEDGVRFVINNLDIEQPIEIVLAAADAAKPAKLLIYKESPQQALFDRDTDASGSVIAKFRTAESVQLMVKGASGSKYQLMAWVGPKMEHPAPPLFTALDANGSPLVPGVVLPPPPAVTQGAAGAVPAQAGQAVAPTTAAIPTYITVLLGAILVAIVVLIVVVLRGRGGKSKGAAAIIALVGFLVWQGGTRAQTADANLAPGLVQKPDYAKAFNEQIGKLREVLDTMEKMGLKNDPEAIKIPHPDDKPDENKSPWARTWKQRPGEFVSDAKLILAFLEEFGLIDPREAAVQPNYNPPGQPLIPSRCAGTGECGACFNDANAKLDKARTLLEDMYVIYKQTELKAGRIHELANAAAGLSPYAQLAWTAIKNNPNEGMNVAQRRFYDTYDTNLGKLLTMANEGLIGVGACEREHYKDYDWYARYGMVYYNFLKDRYTRK
ncbi:MAG TPA: hypothetical protein VL382_05920 [Terriglobales bacterium]|nr:hypothetical protein [Terriglobales bacterium]